MTWNKIIKTEPVDGQQVLAFYNLGDPLDQGYRLRYWSDDVNCIAQFPPGGGDGWQWPITHWMPLHQPPSEGKDADDAEQARAGECPIHKHDTEMVASMLDCPICGNRRPKEDDPRDFSGIVKNYTVRGA